MQTLRITRNRSNCDTCARSTSDAYGRNARKNISDVFAVCDQREQTMRLTSQACALAFGKSAPDPIALTIRERVLQTIKTYAAVHADAFRGITRATALGKKQIRVLAAAQRTLLPVVANAPQGPSPLIANRRSV